MPWSTRFTHPIDLPEGGQIATLEQAGTYITQLPKALHDSTPWQNAMHVLIQAADQDGPIEFARLGMMQALWPKGTPVYHSVDNDGGGIDVSVRHSGKPTLKISFSDEWLQHESCAKASFTTQRDQGSNGLGLHIVHHRHELLSAKINLDRAQWNEDLELLP